MSRIFPAPTFHAGSKRKSSNIQNPSNHFKKASVKRGKLERRKAATSDEKEIKKLKTPFFSTTKREKYHFPPTVRR
jgi:hypothetical protein